MRSQSSRMKRREACSDGQSFTRCCCLTLLGKLVFSLLLFWIIFLNYACSPEVAGSAQGVLSCSEYPGSYTPLRIFSLVPVTAGFAYYHCRLEHHKITIAYTFNGVYDFSVAYIHSRLHPTWYPVFRNRTARSQQQPQQQFYKGGQQQLQSQHVRKSQTRYGTSSLFVSGLCPTVRGWCPSRNAAGGYFLREKRGPLLFLPSFAAALGDTSENNQRGGAFRGHCLVAERHAACRGPGIFLDVLRHQNFDRNRITAKEDIKSFSCVRRTCTIVAHKGRLFAGSVLAGPYNDVLGAALTSAKHPNYLLGHRTADRIPDETKDPNTITLKQDQKLPLCRETMLPASRTEDRGSLVELRGGDTTLVTEATSADFTIKSAQPAASAPSHQAVGTTLQEDEVIAVESALPFPRLGLFPNFVDTLAKSSICTATEIQQLGLPAILSGADVVLGSETGSGKTLGYLLAILQNVLIQKMIHEKREDEAMMRNDDLPLPRHYPYAIIVVPTRELALQVAAWSRRLGRKTPVSTQLLLGSYTRWPFGTLTLPTSPDVIVCTPQVLAGFTRGCGFRQKLLLFEQVQMLVIDEADMLLDGGYKKYMEFIFHAFRIADKPLVAAGKRRTQYVFAAATIPERGPLSIRRIISSLCPEAKFLCTNSLHRQRRELQQEFIEVHANASLDDRIDVLLHKLRKMSQAQRVMIFCNTAQTARQVFQVLEKRLPPAVNPKLFSSDLDQIDRTHNLGLFARERSKVLVCTDAASRGLDIVGVTSVIQFDFASNAITHLHRVGRVARAGKLGTAINFYKPANKPLVDAIRGDACDPKRRSLAAAFSRRRSFRKKLKTVHSSEALVVDYPSLAVNAQATGV